MLYEVITDFGGSDSPLKAEALEKAKLYMFPSVIGSIVLAYNIDGVRITSYNVCYTKLLR